MFIKKKLNLDDLRTEVGGALKMVRPAVRRNKKTVVAGLMLVLLAGIAYAGPRAVVAASRLRASAALAIRAFAMAKGLRSATIINLLHWNVCGCSLFWLVVRLNFLISALNMIYLGFFFSRVKQKFFKKLIVLHSCIK